MIWASGEQKVVNLGLRLRRTVLLAEEAIVCGGGCMVEAAEVVEAAELLPAAEGESNCVSLILLLLRLEVASGLEAMPDLSEAAEAEPICSRQLEPPVCFSSTLFGRCEERPLAEAKLGG